MSSTNKKGIFRCNYCEVEKDAIHMYTGLKTFAGCKTIDILQVVAHRKIPVSTPIKLCALCLTTLHTASAAIERVGHMVSYLLGFDQESFLLNQEEENIQISDSEAEEVEKTQVKPATNGKLTAASQSAKKQLTKVKQTQASTSSKAVYSPAKQPKSNITQTKSPKKQPKELQTSFNENLDHSLEGVIKLSTAKDVSKKKDQVTQMFGTSINHISDSEDGSNNDADDDDAIVNTADYNFECKLCDFKSNFPAKYKGHLRENHGQIRPRILNCKFCPKSFGVLKTYDSHMLTHGIGKENKDDKDRLEKSKNPQLAVITALNPSTKLKPVLNAEYSFDIKNTNSSTPKQNEVLRKVPPPKQIIDGVFQCDVCQLVLDNPKYMQNHLKTVHDIAKPKVFKCPEPGCDVTFAYKHAKDRHFINKHTGEQKKPKTPLRRKTVDVRPSNAAKEKKSIQTKPRRMTAEAEINSESQAMLSQVQENEKDDTVKATNSPAKKSKKAEIKKEDVLTLLDEIFPSTESPSKRKSKGKKTEENQLQDSKSVIVSSPAISNGTPKQRSLKRKSESLQVDTETQGDKKFRKSESELLEEVNNNPLPNKREILESQESDSQLSCIQCSKVVNSRKRLDSHIRKKHKIFLTCRNCKFTSSNTQEYLDHFVNCDQNAEGLHCGVENCSKVFAAPDFLSTHLQKKHKLN